MKVFIITEGNAATGYGHLTRCLAIYQGFEEINIFPEMIANCDNNGKKILGNIKLSIYDWISDTNKLLKQINKADIAIVDSYLADLPLYQNISKSVSKAVYIDDNIRLEYPPGIIINGSVGAENLPYKRDDQHKYLLGLDYTPLRKAFWDIPNRRNKNFIKNVLITIGGSDIRGITFQVLDKVLSSYPNFQYHVVLGYNGVQSKCMEYKRNDNVNFYSELSAEQMRDLMLKCYLAISAAGQTTYELNRIGLKCLVVKIADNQMNNIKGWINSGYINSYVSFDNLEEIIERFKELLKLKRPVEKIVNGNGVRNIIREITK